MCVDMNLKCSYIYIVKSMFIIESTADQTPITIIQVLPSQHMSVAILAQGFILAPVEAQACPCRSRINEQQTYTCLH